MRGLPLRKETKMSEILSRIRERLIKEDYEAVLVSSEENQRYVSGFHYTDGYILICKSSAYLLADFRYIEAAKAGTCKEDFEVIRPNGSMTAEIALLCAVNGIKRIYVEDETLSFAMLERFKKAVKDVSLESGASEVILELRAVKTQSELDLIARAQDITDAAFSHILDILDPKMTEIEVALELEYFMRRNGADRAGFDTIAVSGSASSMPHGVPRNVPLERGFLTMDFGACIDGYTADMTRTVVIGKADDDMKKLYNTVLTAQRAALDIISEGVDCKSVDTVARDIIDAAVYKGCFGHSLGHGVGLYVHELPRFAPSTKEGTLLARGNVVTVEPGIYIEGKYGCRIEDMIAIDLDGKMINFTKSEKELIEI